eukprot:scaffold82298_cov45-Cyclotella_meneghiniana.AAC.15
MVREMREQLASSAAWSVVAGDDDRPWDNNTPGLITSGRYQLILDGRVGEKAVINGEGGC